MWFICAFVARMSLSLDLDFCGTKLMVSETVNHSFSLFFYHLKSAFHVSIGIFIFKKKRICQQILYCSNKINHDMIMFIP